MTDRNLIPSTAKEKYRTIRAQHCSTAFRGPDAMRSAHMHPAGRRLHRKPSAPIKQDPPRPMQSVACQSEDCSVISLNLLVQKQPSALHSTASLCVDKAEYSPPPRAVNCPHKPNVPAHFSRGLIIQTRGS